MLRDGIVLSSRGRRPARPVLFSALLLCLTLVVSVVVSSGGSAEAASTTTYTATQTIPVPPASTYAGSGGGDGWGLALSATQVFNVFHHSDSLTVACHQQSDASECWTPETITDPSTGAGFATSGHAGLWLAQNSGKLYVYATRATDQTAGVVCVDTTTAASNTDPFCGFTALSAIGSGPIAGGISGIGEPVMVNGKWYAVNYASGAVLPGENALLCFDTSSLAACSGQPYAISFGSASPVPSWYPEPGSAAIGSAVFAVMPTDNGTVLTCTDTTTHANCLGSWPVSAPSAESGAAPIPLLSATGAAAGVCLPITGDPCFNMNGAAVAPPAGLLSAVGQTSSWSGQSVVLGPRVYVPDGDTNAIDCFDYATGASCSGFPKTMGNLSLLYSVTLDPQRPTCLWVNADNGSGQIQNFDAYSGSACGQGPIRVLASSFVVPTSLCEPTSYNQLTIDQPARGTYTSGTVSFQDSDANAIGGAADRPIDASGNVSLSGLNLSTATGLPQFLITLNGATGAPAAVKVTLTWTGTYDQSCIAPGTTTSAGSGGKLAAIGDSFSAGEGLPPYDNGTDIQGYGLAGCHRSQQAYAPLLAAQYWQQPQLAAFAACSGAITNDLFKPNHWFGDGSTGQIGKMDADTKTVTLTIGGNDAGFAKLIEQCLQAQVTPVAPVAWYAVGKCMNGPAGQDALKALDALSGVKNGFQTTPFDPNGLFNSTTKYPVHSWNEVFKAIHAKAPSAHIFIAGYPVLFDSTGPGLHRSIDNQYVCSAGRVGPNQLKHGLFANVRITQDNMDALASLVYSANNKLRAATKTADVASYVTYVDVSSAFADHGLCDVQPWINQASISQVVWQNAAPHWYTMPGSFHPNAAGQQAYELAFIKAMDKVVGVG